MGWKGLLGVVLAFVVVGGGCGKRRVNRPRSLEAAVRWGDMHQVESFIAHGADVHQKDEYGDTPLHDASTVGRVEIGGLLLAHGADINARGRDGETPLYTAVTYGQRAFAEFLIRKGANVNLANRHERTPTQLAFDNDRKDIVALCAAAGADLTIHLAAYLGDSNRVRSLVENQAGVVAQEQDGRTALHIAAREGHRDVVELLIRHGADVNANVGKGWYGGSTALHLAAGRGHADVTRLLIANGAHVNAVDEDSRTPLHWASAGGYKEAIEVLIANGAGIDARDKFDHTPLISALCPNGHVDVAKLLLEHGAAVSVEDRGEGRSLLTIAAELGLEDLVERLIAEGADVNGDIGIFGVTPLWAALAHGHKGIANLLIAKGANVNAKLRDGETPLHLAAQSSDGRLAELLLTHGAETEERNAEGNTALHLAAQQGDKGTVQLLLAHGGDVNAKNWRSMTALHYAASQGHREVILLLLANGASVNAQNKHGDTPLHGAAVRGYKEVIELLVRHGADLQVRDNDGLTAKDRAARRRQKDVILLLTASADAPGSGSQKVTKPSIAAQEQVPAKPERAAMTTVNDPNLEALRVPRVQLSESAQARRNEKDLVRANSAFAAALYQQLSSEKGNIFFSPYSISTALAMTYAAARENTEKEMARTLHFTLDQKDLHPAFAELQRSLDKVQRAGNVRLYVANSLWPQRGKPFLNEYLSLVGKYYGVAITPVDYRTESTRTDARRTINAWVEKQTQDKIKDLLQPHHLNDRTRLVLANAIYFKGDWEHQFKAKDTEDAPFYVTPTNSVKTPMMKQTEEAWYGETQGLQILQLMYRGGELSMLILLPRERDGLGKVEKDLSQDIGLWRQRLTEKEVVVFLPKSRITVMAELKKTLQKMGMVEAFQFPGANLGGFDGDPNWFYIGEVIHKAYVDVNEEGTEAAAATAVEMMLGGMGVQPPVFRADHPFLFLIQENRTGSILFLGRVADPTQTGQ